jgi:hypothetical protein
MNNIIYIGSTDNPNKFHVGMTSNNRSPLLRWQDGDYRGKLPYTPQRVEFYTVGDLRDEPVHQDILKDDNIYSVKDEEGIRSDEIFRVDSDNPTEYLKNLVEQSIEYHSTGVRRFKQSYTARPHQAQVNQQVLSRFDGNRTVIQPLNLCARFGKTLQGLSLFKESGLEVMVVAAHWLAANQSFINTVEQGWDITSDVAVIKPNYDAFKSALDKGQRVLIDVSLHIDAEKVDPKLISALSAYKKLIYIDEADFGAWTPPKRETAAHFIDSGINLVCVATGTNIDRALIGSTGKIESPITVSYLDLIEGKRGEYADQLSEIVEVGVLNLDANQELVDDLNELSDESRPNMVKVFNRRNSHIQRQVIKKLLADRDFGADVFGMYNTQYGSIDHPAVMVFLPPSNGKKNIDNFVKVGQSIDPEANWIALHGDHYTNRTAEGMVKNIIKSGKDRTVIVSCSMGARSFSVPNIVAVVNCKDGGSIGTAVQQASRCFTPGCDKTHGLVVNYSFDVYRTSSFENDLISSAIDSDPTDSDGAIRRVYGLMDFFKKTDNGDMIYLSETDFIEYVTSDVNLNNMGKATADLNNVGSLVDLLDTLKDIKSNSNTDKNNKGIIDRAITYISDTDKERGEIDPDKKAIKDLIKMIGRVVDCTSNTYYMAPDFTTFKDCIADIACDPDRNVEYVSLVGLDAEVVYNEVYPFLNTSIMDLIITKARECDSLDNFSSSTSMHTETFMWDLAS